MVAVAIYERAVRPYADTNWARFLRPRFERAASLRAFALQIGVEATTAGAWLFDGKLPRLETIREIAPYFKVTPVELCRVIFGEEDAALADLDAGYDASIEAIESWFRQGYGMLQRLRGQPAGPHPGLE